ncbi:MAG: HPP family protein [Planctomycetota bacterium]|jgi:CBS-domain-containing membrane protein
MVPPNAKLNASIGEKFQKLWKYYVLQSSLAGIALLILLLVLDKGRIVAISAMGATAFIVFAMPTAVSAQTRNVIGGHLVGLASGTIFYFIPLPYLVEYPLAVGIANCYVRYGGFRRRTPPGSGHGPGSCDK